MSKRSWKLAPCGCRLETPFLPHHSLPGCRMRLMLPKSPARPKRKSLFLESSENSSLSLPPAVVSRASQTQVALGQPLSTQPGPCHGPSNHHSGNWAHFPQCLMMEETESECKQEEEDPGAGSGPRRGMGGGLGGHPQAEALPAELFICRGSRPRGAAVPGPRLRRRQPDPGTTKPAVTGMGPRGSLGAGVTVHF